MPSSKHINYELMIFKWWPSTSCALNKKMDSSGNSHKSFRDLHFEPETPTLPVANARVMLYQTELRAHNFLLIFFFLSLTFLCYQCLKVLITYFLTIIYRISNILYLLYIVLPIVIFINLKVLIKDWRWKYQNISI